jgi:hypothetical protein
MASSPAQPWATLIEPDGTDTKILLSEENAEEFCRRHPGWTWNKAIPKGPSPRFEDDPPTTRIRKKKL